MFNYKDLILTQEQFRPKWKCIKTFKDHQNCVTCVTKMSDSTFISGSNDNTLKLWNINNGKCIKTFEGHQNIVGCYQPRISH